MNKLSSFAVVHNHQDWLQYKHEVTNHLLQTNSPSKGAVEFPVDPENFPLLVSSMAHLTDPATKNTLCCFKVSCCYVYQQDADRLLDAVSSTTGSVVVDEVPNEESHIEHHEHEEPDQEDYAPTQTGVLMLALVLEMEAIGALKREKLLAKVQDVTKWLTDNQASNMHDQGLDEILTKLWEAEDQQ